MTLLDAVITLLRRTATSPDPGYVMEVTVQEARALLKALGLKIDPEAPQWRVVWLSDSGRGGATFVDAASEFDARAKFMASFDSQAVVITGVTKEG